MLLRTHSLHLLYLGAKTARWAAPWAEGGMALYPVCLQLRSEKPHSSSSSTWLQQRTSARATQLLGRNPISSEYFDLFHGKAENTYTPPVVINHKLASMAFRHVCVILRLSTRSGPNKGVHWYFCCKWFGINKTVLKPEICSRNLPIYRCFFINTLLILHYNSKTQSAYLKKKV